MLSEGHKALFTKGGHMRGVFLSTTNRRTKHKIYVFFRLQGRLADTLEFKQERGHKTIVRNYEEFEKALEVHIAQWLVYVGPVLHKNKCNSAAFKKALAYAKLLLTKEYAHRLLDPYWGKPRRKTLELRKEKCQ